MFIDSLVRGSSVLSKMDVSFSQYSMVLFQDVRTRFGKQEIGAYITCALVSVVGYLFVSDGVFSGIVSLGSIIQCLGLGLLILKVRSTGSSDGISRESMQIYVLVYLLRLASTVFHEGYLPVDKSGDWAYQLADAISLVEVIALYLICEAREQRFPIGVIFCSCCLLAYFVHPCHNLDTIADIFWTASLYLECFVMIPQLMYLSRVTGHICMGALTSHYIACSFFYRLLNFMFWFTIRDELTTEDNKSELPGYFVVGALLIQIILLADFMYYYLKAVVTSVTCGVPDNVWV